jgi:signal transduction histidine kinase
MVLTSHSRQALQSCSPATLAHALWSSHEKLLTRLCPTFSLEALTKSVEQAKASLLENTPMGMERLAAFLHAQKHPPQLLWPLLPTLRESLLTESAFSSREMDELLLTLASTLQSLFCQIQTDKELGRLAFLGKHFAFLLHEIANPLAIAEASAFRLQTLFAAHGPLVAREPLEQLQTQLASLLETLHQIRMLSWENSKTLQSCLLSSSIEKALAALPENRELHVHTEGLNELHFVQGEPTQLGWIWKNLFENAVRAMKGEGHLLIRTQPSPPHVFVFVEDSGPGIDERVRAQLFEPFVSSCSERTGLGLALAKTIVKRHGGDISLQQSRWGGSCFTVRLQCALPP